MAAKDSPLKQFEIDPISNIELAGYNISFTNSSLSMLITVLAITLFLTLTVNTKSIIPSRMQLVSELMYNFIAQLLSDTVGDNGKKYFPFVFSIFMFVLIGNMVGMIPYQFTFTSHIIVTFALAAVVFIGVTILGFVNHGIKFKRVDLDDNNIIEANYKNVKSPVLCTRIENAKGVSISTIEHLMASLYGEGIDNLLIEIDAPEVPIMDGSAFDFVEEIRSVGIEDQNSPRKFIKVIKKVEIKNGSKVI